MNAYDLRCSWCDARLPTKGERIIHEREEHGMFDGPDETKIGGNEQPTGVRVGENLCSVGGKPYGHGLNVTVPRAPTPEDRAQVLAGLQEIRDAWDGKPTEGQQRRAASKQVGDIALDPFRAKYRKLTDMEQLHLDEVKRVATELYHLIDGRTGYQFVEARLRLEECVMWAVKGVTA